MISKQLYLNGKYDCIISKGNIIVATMRGIGVRPIITTFDRYPDMLKDADVADKIIGRAAAMLVVKAGVRSVYGHIMSEGADKYLTANDIPHSCGELVPKILNRTGDDICPMEKSVLNTNNPDVGIQNIREFIARMMALKATSVLECKV